MNPRLRRVGRDYFTRSLAPMLRVYGERIVKEKGAEWRQWNPFRSKLAAGLSAGLDDLHIRAGDSVLYLGSAEGTTVSHVSDLVGENGFVVGVDISPKAMRVFSKLVESRSNIIPLLADANHPALLKKELPDMKFDVIVQDVSQKNQSDIFVRNWETFASKSAHGYLVIKSRSIDFSKNPSLVLKGEEARIKKHCSIREVVDLGKFEKDHFLVHVVWK
ncbi:MAG: fibrillarin-like rRNA/tRNA 2'-O-methyltransferase [Candidatus Diapherotrites archaeon]